MDYPVRARLTTHGEIEYKKFIAPPIIPVIHDKSVHVGRDLNGNVNTAEVKGDFNAGIEDKEANKINRKSLAVNKWVLILAALAIVVAITIYLLQQAFPK